MIHFNPSVSHALIGGRAIQSEPQLQFASAKFDNFAIAKDEFKKQQQEKSEAEVLAVLKEQEELRAVNVRPRVLESLNEVVAHEIVKGQGYSFTGWEILEKLLSAPLIEGSFGFVKSNLNTVVKPFNDDNKSKVRQFVFNLEKEGLLKEETLDRKYIDVDAGIYMDTVRYSLQPLGSQRLDLEQKAFV